MDLEKIKRHVDLVLDNHAKHGMVGAETLKVMRAGADIALIIVKWELEKKESGVEDRT